jgi:hypothetical protein
MIMSEVTARQNIMTVIQQIVTDWTAYTLAVDSENRDLIDQATQVNPYLEIEIDFLGATQADLGDRPFVRQVGQVVIDVVAKAGSGTAAASALRDFILPRFDLKVLGIVHCHEAELHRSKTIKDWDHFPILVNFWYYRLTA